MKQVFGTIVLSALFSAAICQGPMSRGEFANNPNGLMYSDTDMAALRFVVDSLNLKFKTCDLSKTFYSQPQVKVFYIHFLSESGDLQDVIDDMNNVMSPQELIKKYGVYIKDSNSAKIIIASGKDQFLSGSPGKGYDREIVTNGKNFNTSVVKNRWSYSYIPKSPGWSYSTLRCYYYLDYFRSSPISPEYGKLIQYVDCMIDTSAITYLTDREIPVIAMNNPNPYLTVNAYINKAMKRKKRKNDWTYHFITQEKVEFAANNLKNDSVFIQLVKDAAAARQAGDGLEELIGIFVSKQVALDLKRSRGVIGMCSQDPGPRIHARNIAILAAEAHNWNVFVRAHLDIMNDRFDRLSDGSYAYGGRKTYLKELEELDLDIVDLMLGLTLRSGNVAPNHYYGTIWRMGWALTESKEKDAFEKKALAMIKDDRLDEFNRGLVFLLYKTYLSYLDEKEALPKIKSLKQDVTSFPGFMQPSINELKEKRDNRNN